jgi:hypothetical protein
VKVSISGWRSILFCIAGLTVKALVHSQVSCEVCGAKELWGHVFLKIFVFSCHYHTTIASYSYSVHPPPTVSLNKIPPPPKVLPRVWCCEQLCV